MRQDQLSDTLAIRIAPALREELASAAAAEDISIGEMVRRAIRSEIDTVVGRNLDPHLSVTLAQTDKYLVEAVQAMGSPGRIAELVSAVDMRLGDVLEAVVQAANVLQDEAAHQRFERTSGYLRQASEDLLHAACQTKAIRFIRMMENEATLMSAPHLGTEEG